VRSGFEAGYAESIQTVFIVAVPIAALAFLATWFIPQVSLKQWDPAESVAESVVPPESLQPIEALEPEQASTVEP